MNNWKTYLIVLGINLLAGFLLSINCKGERCMIVVIAFSYCVIASIAYLPYLFYKPLENINNKRLLAFLFPSILMFAFALLWIKLGSNIPTNSHNLLFIFLVILPNTLLQLILFFVPKLKHLVEISDKNNQEK